jgi:hypothetical protein
VSVGQAASKQGVSVGQARLAARKVNGVRLAGSALSVGQARLAARKVNGVRLAGSECGTGKR